MKTKNYLLTGMIFTAMIFSLSSCNKDDDTTSDEEKDANFIEVVKENMIFESIEEEVDASANEAIAYFEEPEGLKSAALEDNCAVVTISPSDNTFPKTITIDFGDGCSGLNGRLRKGSLTITLTDSLRKAGAEYTVEFNDFSVDDYVVAGTQTVTNTGSEEVISFSEKSQLLIATPEGGPFEKEKEITKTWIEGADTYTLSDDKFEITGNASVSSFEIWYYSYTITEPLVVSRSCGYIVQGVIEMSWYDAAYSVIVDYGDGSCDSEFSYSFQK